MGHHHRGKEVKARGVERRYVASLWSVLVLAGLLVGAQAAAADVPAEAVGEGRVEWMEVMLISVLLVVLLLLKRVDRSSDFTFWRLRLGLRRRVPAPPPEAFTLSAFRESMGRRDAEGVFLREEGHSGVQAEQV